MDINIILFCEKWLIVAPDSVITSCIRNNNPLVDLIGKLPGFVIYINVASLNDEILMFWCKNW